jgi:hypothetical protein
MTTFKSTWEHFANSVIAKDAPPIQLLEMKRAFYAGGFQLILLILFETENLSEDEGASMINDWNNEIKQYFDEVINDNTNS